MASLKSVGGFLASLVVEPAAPVAEGEESSEQTPSTPASSARGPVARPTVISSAARPAGPRPTPPVVDQATVDMLTANVAKGTSQAFQAFERMYDTLTMVPEGPTRIQAAIAASGASPQDIINELDRRLKQVDTELQTVEGAAEAARARTVGSLQGRISQIDAQTQEKRDKIAELEETVRLLHENIAEHDSARADLVGQIPNEEAKISGGLTKFKQAHSHVRAQLTADRATLVSMLPSGN